MGRKITEQSDLTMRVADYVVKFVFEIGVKHIFMVSGGGIMYLTDALKCNKNLQPICLHHEQAVSIATEAYSRITENFGVGFVTSGPGGINALLGVATAWTDSIPCLFISGQAKLRETTFKANITKLRQFGVQEFNIIPIVKQMTKYSAFVDKPEDIKCHLQKAVYYAKKGRPGPSWLDIPVDIQGTLINTGHLKEFTYVVKPEKNLDMQIEQVIQYIQLASNPVILAGHGVRISGAIGALLKFANNYKIPIVTTFLSYDIINSDNPQCAGCIGIKGNESGNLAVKNSDLLIVLGSSLPVAQIGYEYNEFAKNAKIIVVDIDASSHKKKIVKVDLLIQCNIKDFLEKLDKTFKND